MAALRTDGVCGRNRPEMIRSARMRCRCVWLLRCSMVGILIACLNCAGPRVQYPSTGFHLTGPCCSSTVGAQRPKVVVVLKTGQRFEGQLVRVICEPETSIVMDFRYKRGMFRVAGQPDSLRLALREIRSINNLQPRTTVGGVILAVGTGVLAMLGAWAVYWLTL